MNTTDNKIAEVLGKFGEPMAGNVWRVQGTAVIYHKTLERIAAQAGITWDLPTIVRAEREEAAILVAGRMKDRMEWSIGEATIGMNYRVSGKQAAYPWAMAEKRAKDRVILKLIELSGFVYSEEEADEFKNSANFIAPSSEQSQPTETEKKAVATSKTREEEITEVKLEIEKASTVAAVTNFMLASDTQNWLESLPEAFREDVRAYAKDKMKSLGWQSKRVA